MKLFTDLLSWIAAHIVVFWWKRENRNTPHRCDAGNETAPIAQAKGVKIYSLDDINRE
jgi:hypothetical protein